MRILTTLTVATGMFAATTVGNSSRADLLPRLDHQLGASVPGITFWVTHDLSCLQAQVTFDVNQYTRSVGLRFLVLSSTGQLKVGWSTPDEVRNVNPSSTGHTYVGTGLDAGDQIVFGLLTYDAPDAGGTNGVSPRTDPQSVTDCVS